MNARTRLALQSAALATALAFPFAGHADLYKWVDSSGHTQYSDKPPVGVNAETVKNHLSSVQSGGGSGQADTPAEQEQAFRKRQKQAQDANKKQDADAERQQDMQQACDSARSRAAGLEAGGRQVRFDPTGERHYLDDSEISQAKSSAQQDIGKYCK
jgi:hypothetical protein